MTFGANYFMNLMNGNTGMGLLGMNGMYGFGTNYDNGMMWANVAMGTVNNIFSAIQRNYAYNDSPSSVGGGGRTDTRTVDDIQADLDDVNTKLANPSEYIDEKYQTNIDTANERLTTISSDITEKETNLRNTTRYEKNADGADSTTETVQYKALKRAIDNLKAEAEKLLGDKNTKGSIEYLEEQKNQAELKLQEELNEKKTALEAELRKAENSDSNEATEATVETKKFNAVQNTLSPKRKAISDFAKAKQAVKDACKPGKSMQKAIEAIGNLRTAYSAVNGLSSQNDSVSEGIKAVNDWWSNNGSKLGGIKFTCVQNNNQETDTIETVNFNNVVL